MWGCLILKPLPKAEGQGAASTSTTPANNKSTAATGGAGLTTPNRIEFDVSKSVHHVGRLPNPAKPFTHLSQHVIPLTFMSATHFSVGVESVVGDDFIGGGAGMFKYWITDHSSNGTYLYRRPDEPMTVDDDGTSSAFSIDPTYLVRLTKNEPTELVDGALVVFQYSNAVQLCYEFQPLVPSIDALFLPSMAPRFTPLSINEEGKQASNASNSALKQQLVSLQNEVEAAQQRYDSVNARMTQLQTQQREQQQAAEEALTQLTTLQDEKTSLEAEITEITEKNLMLVSRYSANEENLKLKVREISELQARVEVISTELEYRSKQVHSRDEMINSCNGQIEEQRVMLEKIQGDYLMTSNQLTLCKQQLDKTQTVSNALQSTLGETIQENEILKNGLLSSRAALVQLSDMEAQLMNYRKQSAQAMVVSLSSFLENNDAGWMKTDELRKAAVSTCGGALQAAMALSACGSPPDQVHYGDHGGHSSTQNVDGGMEHGFARESQTGGFREPDAVISQSRSSTPRQSVEVNREQTDDDDESGYDAERLGEGDAVMVDMGSTQMPQDLLRRDDGPDTLRSRDHQEQQHSEHTLPDPASHPQDALISAVAAGHDPLQRTPSTSNGSLGGDVVRKRARSSSDGEIIAINNSNNQDTGGKNKKAVRMCLTQTASVQAPGFSTETL
jgi:hypothetical protein